MPDDDDRDVIVVPLSIRNGLAFVTVDLDGKPAHLYVNTGGGHLIALTPLGLSGHAVQKLSASGSYQDAFGNIFHSQRFLVSKVSLSGMVLNDVEGGELRSGPPRSDGYLGLPALGAHTVVFDYPKSQMRLYPSADAEAVQRECDKSVAALSRDDEGLKSTIRIEEQDFGILWDTGASGNAMRPSALPADANPRHWLPWQTPHWTPHAAVLGDIDVTPIDFQLLAFQKPNAAAVLGYDFFKSRVVCFDIARARVGISSRRSPVTER